MKEWLKRVFSKCCFVKKAKQLKDPDISATSVDSVPLNAISPVVIKSSRISKTVGNISAGRKSDVARIYEQHGTINGYQLQALLGEGSFGFVFSALRLSGPAGDSVALKFMYRDRVVRWVDDVPAEVAFLRLVSSGVVTGVIHFIEYFEILNDERFVVLVTELFGHPWRPRSSLAHVERARLRRESPRDLFECIEAKVLTEPAIHRIFSQLYFSVTELLKRHRLLHRDIKDENILVAADYEIRLIDFGSASILRPSNNLPSSSPQRAEGISNLYYADCSLDAFNGTLAFAAPEVFHFPTRPYLALPVEVWTLGVVLYTMVFGRAPFEDAHAVKFAPLQFPIDSAAFSISGMVCCQLITVVCVEKLKALMAEMLQKNPRNRVSLEGIGRHPWMQADYSAHLLPA